MCTMDHHRQEQLYTGIPLRSPLPRKDKSAFPSEKGEIRIKITDLREQLEQRIETLSRDRKIRIISLAIFESLCTHIVFLDWIDTSWKSVYVLVDFPDILRLNEEACTDTTLMLALKEAIGLLFKYGVNLLKLDVSTSTAWRVISFDNTMYRSQVRLLKGHKQILYLYGYTKEMSYGLSFPDALHTPNANTVAKVAADLAVAYFEIDLYIRGSHPYPQRIGKLIQGATSRIQTPDSSSGYSSYISESSSFEDNSVKESTLQDVRNYADNPLVKSSYQLQEPEVFPKALAMGTGKEKQLNIEKKQSGHVKSQSSSSQSSPLYNQVEIKLTKCGICKQNTANMRCNMCSQPRCKRCDELWHRHPQRQGHTRHPIVPGALEAVTEMQPGADINQVHNGAAALPPVISTTTISKTNLPGGRSARTSNGFTLPEIPSAEDTGVSAGANDHPDSPLFQQGFNLMAEDPQANCDFCGTKPSKKFCSSCNETYCLECDDKRHSNPQRKDHKRQDVTQITKPGNSRNDQITLPDDQFQLPQNVLINSSTAGTINKLIKSSTAEADNQELDSIVSTYFSVPGVPVDSSYINSEEDLDVRAPPNDRYRVPMERASVSPAAPTTEKHKSPALEESPYMYVTPLKGGGMAPQHRSGVGTLRQMELQAELNRITAEDIVTLEKLFSVRSLREQESDSDKIAVLMQEEQKLTQMHEEFQKKLKVLQTHISGISGESRHGAAGAGPQDIPVGAAIAAGAGAGIPQGKSLPPVTSAENMSAATNSPEIRQQILDPAKTSRQEPRDTQQSAQEEGWTCQHCTFLNTNMESNICSVCDKTSFPKAKIQPIVRPKETKAQPSNSASEVQMKPTTKEERRKKNAEYYQQLEAEMLAEKQHAKDEYSRHSGSPQVDPTIIAPKKALEKSKPLSDTDLLELAQLIPHGRCIKLGIELGFSHHELNKLQVRDPMGISGGGIFEMLRMWKGDVRGHEQRPKLKQILANAGLLGLTHVLEENRFTQDEPSVSSPKAKTIRNSTALPSRMSTSSGKTAPDEVSEGELLQLSRMIPVDSIRELGFNLQFSYSKVQDFLHRHRMNFQVTILYMLHEWKNRTRHSDQRRELNNILIDSNLGGLTLAEVVSKPKVESREPRGITDIELYELADSLNAENITQLGLYLGFGMAAISRYQHEAALESPREGTRRMLLDWKNHEPETDQRECLSNVLDQIGCMHLGEKIRNYLGFTKHHDTFGESLQQQLSHATSFGDLSYVKDEEKMKYEEMRTASLERIAELREAESQGIPTERIKCALYIMEEYGADLTDPIEWIAVNWSDVISELAHKATQELRENLEVDVDPKIMELVQVSAESAEKCLQDCSGNIEEAVKECTQRTQEKILEIQEFDCFSVDDTVAVLKLDDVQGDAEKALDALQGKAMAEYVDRVWTSTNDDDNEYFQEAIRNDDRSIRMLMVEYSMRSWGRAQTAAKLIVRSEFPVDDVVIAAEECGDLRRSEVFLKQQCSVCFIDLPRNKLMSLINCQCMMCRECVIAHFEVIARDKSIMKGTCPACDMPNLDDQAVAADYFAFLDILLRDMLTPEVYELFQRKLRDWNLMQDENFCWCAHCNSGFINGAPDRRKMRCPECNKLTCFNCKKQWMDQHEGISCEAFQEWKENNDPDLQAQGLAAHLNENGIDCPRCKMRYELAKGGCMHFKCPQCTFEFCCGCNEPIKKDCDKFASCPKKGLHAHHPRDCLFYLRDEEIAFLKKLLDDAKVEYNKVPPEGAEENEEGECGVKEQKDGPNGLEDNKCGRKVTPGNAGLCRIHYIEYLVGLINGKNIDPAKSFRINQLEAILNREDIPVPARRPAEADPDYRKRLLIEVQTKLPLKKSTRGRAR